MVSVLIGVEGHAMNKFGVLVCATVGDGGTSEFGYLLAEPRLACEAAREMWLGEFKGDGLEESTGASHHWLR